MGLSTREQLRYWGIAAAVFLLFLWVMGNTLLPFVVGAAIAYLLNPFARWLQARGFSRIAATSLITLMAVVGLILVGLVLIPALAQQIAQLIGNLPDYVAGLRQALEAAFPAIFDENSGIRRMLSGTEETLRSGGLALVQQVLASSLAVLDAVLLIVLAPVVAFYLLLDWDRMVTRIDDLIPREHVAVVRRLAAQVDEVLSGFVRGQMMVCAILGAFYAVALSLVGLQFGAVVGIFAGLISFVPFVGSILGGVISVGLALVQFWGDWVWIGAVAVIFIAGQAVEGNVLTPQLVGDRIKLHPVWLIFALSAFGGLLGFTGLLVAVPLAAMIGVLVRFFIGQYKAGPLYTGPAEVRDKPRDAAE